jgi:hypothetical protein
MHMLNRVLLVAIAAGLVMGSPATAQIKNPIQAAKDAFKKAKEEEEAKRAQQRPQQPPRPQQPTSAPASAAAAGGATADCCSPEALSKLAASVGFIDIVGVKLGMTLEQAVAALKANPKLVIEFHDMEIVAGGKTGRRPRVILAHLPAASRNSEFWGNLDGSHEAIGVQLTAPPGPMVVETISRYVHFATNAPVAASTLLDALRKKYGPESEDQGLAQLMWIYDTTGKLLGPPTDVQRRCLGGQMGEIRSGSGDNQPGKLAAGFNEYTPTFGQFPGFDEYSAKCVSYVTLSAQIQHGSPTEQVGEISTTLHSVGLKHNSLALAAAFIKRENENLIKQQEDAAAKRGAPKL